MTAEWTVAGDLCMFKEVVTTVWAVRRPESSDLLYRRVRCRLRHQWLLFRLLDHCAKRALG